MNTVIEVVRRSITPKALQKQGPRQEPLQKQGPPQQGSRQQGFRELHAATGRATVIRVLQAVLLLGLLSPPEGSAQTFSAPDSCGTVEDFRHRLSALMDPENSEVVDATLSIETLTDGSLEMRLRFAGTQRRLRHADCSPLLQAAAVIMAAHHRSVGGAGGSPETSTELKLGIPAVSAAMAARSSDDDSPSATKTGTASDTEDEGDRATEEAASSEETTPTTDRDTPRARDGETRTSGSGITLQASAGATLRTLPAIARRLAVGGGFDVGPIWLEAEFSLLLPETTSIGTNAALTTRAYLGSLRIGSELSSWLLLGAGAVAGATLGETSGSGLRQNGSGEGMLLGLHVELAPRLRIWPGGTLEFPLSGRFYLLRPEFEVAGLGQVFRVPALDASLCLRFRHLFQ